MATNRPFFGGKKCGRWLWGGRKIREFLDDFASRGRIRGLRFANFSDAVPPRRKRSDATRANRDGSNHSAFIGKFERALNSTLDVGKRVPPYMWVFPRPQPFFDKTACGQERKCAYFSRQSGNSGEIVRAPRATAKMGFVRPPPPQLSSGWVLQ